MPGAEVVLLLVLGQTVHQVVSGLVGDVRQQPAHYGLVPVQLKLDGVSSEAVRSLSSLLLATYTG